MSIAARIYVYAVILIGACVTLSELIRWESQDLLRFVCYMALAMMASRLKVALPAITGTLSVTFIFVLFGVVELSLPEALCMGLGATLIQCFWHHRERPKPYQVLFNLGSIADRHCHRQHGLPFQSFAQGSSGRGAHFDGYGHGVLCDEYISSSGGHRAD